MKCRATLIYYFDHWWILYYHCYYSCRSEDNQAMRWTNADLLPKTEEMDGNAGLLRLPNQLSIYLPLKTNKESTATDIPQTRTASRGS